MNTPRAKNLIFVLFLPPLLVLWHGCVAPPDAGDVKRLRPAVQFQHELHVDHQGRVVLDLFEPENPQTSTQTEP